MSLSKSSISKLQTCHKDIQRVTLAASMRINIQVIEGARNLERQKELFALKKTKTMDSKHLINDKRAYSDAIDLAPLKPDGSIDWKDTAAFLELKKIMFEEAQKLDIKLRWGGDWDRDGDYRDEKFLDLVHFERDY